MGAWDYKSGNGRNLLQAVAGKRPTLRTAVQNGLSVIRCDGIDYFIQVSAVNLGSQPLTVFCVGKVPASTVALLWDGGSAGTHRAALFFDFPVGGEVAVYASSFVGGAHTAGGFNVYEGIYNGVSSKVVVNGSVLNTGDAGATGLGDGLTAGNSFAGTNSAAIDMCEYLVYAGLLSAGESSSVRAYLKAKWGTP